MTHRTCSTTILGALAIVALLLALGSQGCGAIPPDTRPFAWQGIEGKVAAMPDGVDAGLHFDFQVFGVPVRIAAQYSRETIGACAEVPGVVLPACVKYPIGGEPSFTPPGASESGWNPRTDAKAIP